MIYYTGLTEPSGECLEGYYCTLGAIEANPISKVYGDICPAGSYCTNGTATPEACPEGTYNPDTSKTFFFCPVCLYSFEMVDQLKQ